MSSPRFWKICQFNPSDVFKCVGPVDRTLPSYEEITVETVNEVFNRIIVSSPMNFFNTDDATRSLIERVDNGEEQVSVHYHVVLDFNGVNSAADLAKDRQAIIDAIENWCGKCNIQGLRGYRAYAIKRPKFTTVCDFASTPPFASRCQVTFDVVMSNAVWYSGRRVTTGCLAARVYEDFASLKHTLSHECGLNATVQYSDVK